MMAKKEKLTPIPARRPARRGKPGETAAVASTPPAEPDLSHITESLRDKAVSVADIAFLVGNCLTHPEAQVEELKASLRVFGQVEPLIVNRRPKPAVVIGGNGRLQAALALGWGHVAVTFVDLPPGKANALAIALNRTQEGSEWDAAAVDAMLRDVDTGNDAQLDGMLAGLATELKIVPEEVASPSGGPFPYKQQYGVIIACAGEPEQKDAYEKLLALGYECKVVVT